MISKRAFLLAVALCAAPLLAAPNKMCIPVANGVPGTLAWQRPPNWWNPAEGEPLHNTALNAPGWRGATAVSFPAGGAGTDHVHFRALHRNVSGTEYLFLSWWGKVIPKAADGANELYVGFHDAAGAGQDIVLKITVTSFADTGTRSLPVPSASQYTASLFVKPFGSADNAWTTYSGSPAVPAWINGAGGTGRLWLWNESLMPSLPAQWAFQLRVPITTSNDLNNGIRISSPFNLWYEFRVADPMAGNGYTPYFWPRTTSPMNFSDPRPVAQWGEARLTSGTPENPDPNCPSDGVSLKSSDILTLNPDPHSVRLGLNTLRAIPFNGMSTSVSLTATFRFADWGTGATWESVPNPNTTLWKQLGNPGGPVLITAGTPGIIDTTYTASQCDACQYRGYYLAHKGLCDSTCPASTNDKKATHQCMLVQLSGPGADFVNDSAYTNMNFADTSEYSEDAAVNLSGLPETSPGSLARDVYIFVQRSNMPPSTTPSGPGRPSTVEHQHDGFDAVTPDNCIPSVISDPNVPRERRKAEILKGLSQRAFTYEDLQSTIPTVIYHAYYDTLQRTAAGSPILLPLNPFGYFPMHDGTPAGWKALLEGAEELSPNWYRVRVGPSGVATVRPVIEAIEPGGGDGAGRYRFFLDAGLNFPQGSFGDGIDGQLSINAGLERFVAANTSVEAILGYHAFDSDFGSNPRIWQLSANLKQYFGEGRLRYFVNGGAGAYRFDPGSTTRAGANVGTGVLYDLPSVWDVEGVYNFHVINTSDSRTRFSTVQIGIRRNL